MFQFSSLNAPQQPRLTEHPRLKTDIDAIPVSDEERRNSLIKDINLRLEEVQESRAVMQGAGIGIHLYFCDGSQKDGSAGLVYTTSAAPLVYGINTHMPPSTPMLTLAIVRKRFVSEGGRKLHRMTQKCSPWPRPASTSAIINTLPPLARSTSFLTHPPPCATSLTLVPTRLKLSPSSSFAIFPKHWICSRTSLSPSIGVLDILASPETKSQTASLTGPDPNVEPYATPRAPTSRPNRPDNPYADGSGLFVNNTSHTVNGLSYMVNPPPLPPRISSKIPRRNYSVDLPKPLRVTDIQANTTIA